MTKKCMHNRVKIFTGTYFHIHFKHHIDNTRVTKTEMEALLKTYSVKQECAMLVEYSAVPF